MSAKKKQSTLFRFFKPVEPNSTNEPVLTKDASAIAIAVDNKENVVTPKKINHELSDTEDQPVYIVNKIKKFKSKRIIEDDEMDIETPRRALKNFSYKEATQTPSIKPISSAKKHQTPSSSFTKTPSKSQKFKEKNETRYKWLLEIKDKDQNPPSHPDYDPKTLYIPPAAYQAFTPFEKQFWEIKSAHYNTIVFFKKGKFFELYENDATIGHQQFDLKLTDRVNMRMVGVPESSFHHWASQFIAKGYKVAKVEQMENAMGKKINDKNNKKDDKIIKRELTSVLTCGTLVDGGFLTTDAATYCMSIKVLETNKELIGTNEIKYGICFVDTATCEINVSCFSDDLERTQLETLITQINPKELVLQKTCSKNLLKIVKNLDFNFLTDQEFWSFENTVDELQNYYYPGVKVDDFNGTLVKIMKDEMGTSALGGLLSYLRTLKLDKDMLAGNLNIYDPVKSLDSLLLDGQTLLNLEVFQNSGDGSDLGTLFKMLNHCSSPGGKRLFKKWVCHPLRDVSRINDRLDAIDDLVEGGLDDVLAFILKMPDLERIIARIQSGGCLVKDFVSCLEAFETIKKLFEGREEIVNQFKSEILKKIARYEYSKNVLETLEYFSKAFDHSLASQTGKISLFNGFDEDYDQKQQDCLDIEQNLENYRKELQRTHNLHIEYKAIGKELYQLQIPSREKAPKEWTLMSKTKDVSRYYTPKLRDLIEELIQAREICEISMRDIKKRVYQKFSIEFKAFTKIIQNLSELDCLFSLTLLKRTTDEPCCRPMFLDGESCLELEEMRNPCVEIEEYIPNDLTLGSTNTMVLLTGPNMGGKSTLLRQTCIAVIMAQIGCYLPAAKCNLTPCDRIFTRIGANDNIMAGQSTFMVELSETAKILKEATKHSLVILDELGRGTSTFDGYAIAYSVLHHLVAEVCCLGLFSTHYGSLTKEFVCNPMVALKYMSFCVDQESKKVVFLYKLEDGVCAESYGMNVARMAGVPEEIIINAEGIAKVFEGTHAIRGEDGVKLHQLALFKGVFGGGVVKVWDNLQ